MRIFVVEYVTGGGLLGQPLPPTLAREGAAMLEAVVSDFVTAGVGEVITLRDPRFEPRLPSSVRQLVITESFDERVDACLAMSDAALVIAPETGGVLAELTER